MIEDFRILIALKTMLYFFFVIGSGFVALVGGHTVFDDSQTKHPFWSYLAIFGGLCGMLLGIYWTAKLLLEMI